MSCNLDENWCAYHKRYHTGDERELSQRLDYIGETYRRYWTGLLREPADEIYIVMNSAGIGDSLLLLTVTAGIKEKYGVKVTLGVPEALLGWCSVFPSAYDELVPSYTLAERNDLYFPYDSYAMELHEKSRARRHDYYLRFLHPYSEGYPVIPEAVLPPEDIQWARQWKDHIVLAPFSAWPSRTWLQSNWMILEDELIANGKKTLVIDKDPRKVAPFSGKKLVDLPATQLLALCRAARLVVANDSGVAHATGIVRGRGLVLCGPTRGADILAPYSLTILQGGLPCTGCYWRSRYTTKECHYACASLQSINVGDVFNTILDMTECVKYELPMLCAVS